MLGAPRSTSVRHAFTPTLEITAKQVVHDYLDNDKKHAKGKWEANHAAIGLPVPFLVGEVFAKESISLGAVGCII